MSEIIKYNKKYNFCDNLSIFYDSILALVPIRTLGDIKHGFDMCEKTPVGNDGDLVSNINAIARHFTLYCTGDKTDESGNTHLAHMLGRCMILLTRHYRLVFGTYDDYINKPDVHIENPSELRSVTSELLISILKYNKDAEDIKLINNIPREKKKQLLIELIRQLLLDITFIEECIALERDKKHINHNKQTLINTITKVDILYYYTNLLFKCDNTHILKYDLSANEKTCFIKIGDAEDKKLQEN